jgi:hypothetical protein
MPFILVSFLILGVPVSMISLSAVDGLRLAKRSAFGLVKSYAYNIAEKGTGVIPRTCYSGSQFAAFYIPANSHGFEGESL